MTDWKAVKRAQERAEADLARQGWLLAIYAAATSLIVLAFDFSYWLTSS